MARLAAAGHSVTEAVVDVTDRAALDAVIDEVAAVHGRLDAVFANAGMSAGPSYQQPAGTIEAIDPASWQQVIDLNLTSVFATIQAAARQMKQQRDGRIVVTASIAGLGSDDMVGYGYIATKAAVINLVRQAARELAPYNVMINAIAPGPFLTNIANGRLNDPEIVRQFAEKNAPRPDCSNPMRLRGLALLLASPASSYLTGTVIPIDGGISA